MSPKNNNNNNTTSSSSNRWYYIFGVGALMLMVLSFLTSSSSSSKDSLGNALKQQQQHQPSQKSDSTTNTNNFEVVKSSSSSTTTTTRKFETAEDFMIIDQQQNQPSEQKQQEGERGSDQNQASVPETTLPPPTTSSASPSTTRRPRRPRRFLPPPLSTEFSYQATLAMMVGLNLSLSINRDDPFFSSPQTCNSINGGQKFPPPVCSKENPCKKLALPYTAAGIARLEKAQYDSDDLRCSGWGCSATLRPGWKKNVDPKTNASSFYDVGCNVKEKLQFQIYSSLPMISKMMSERTGPTQEEMLRVLPRWRWYDDGPMQKISVPNTFIPEAGTRHFCKYVPPPTSDDDESAKNNIISNRKKVPLVILLPGTAINASENLYNGPLRDFARRRKIAVISIQPLNRHWHASGWIGRGESGTKNDFLFRNFTHNDDIKFLDTLIDDAVESGRIDPKRIYLFGGSNGLTFATFYGIMRSGSRDGGALLYSERSNRTVDPELQRLYTGRTPGGNRIAAVGGSSGLDPFQGVGWNEKCHTWPLPKSKLPFFVVSTICDVVKCTWIREWLTRMINEVGSSDVRWTLMDMKQRVRPASYCTEEREAEVCTDARNILGHTMHADWVPVMVVKFLLSKKLQD